MKSIKIFLAILVIFAVMGFTSESMGAGCRAVPSTQVTSVCECHPVWKECGGTYVVTWTWGCNGGDCDCGLDCMAGGYFWGIKCITWGCSSDQCGTGYPACTTVGTGMSTWGYVQNCVCSE